MIQQISHRKERVNELMKRELVMLLKQDTKDPRLQDVVITDVIVSRDLGSAKVFFSVAEESQEMLHHYLIKPVVFLDRDYLKSWIYATHHHSVLSMIQRQTLALEWTNF